MNFLATGLLRANARSIAIFALGWLLVIGGIVAFLARSQADTRERERQRFEARADIAAGFVSTYVGDLVVRQRDMARRRLSGDRISRRVFETAVADSGYTAAVLLDSRGRVIRIAPSRPGLIGTRIAPRYPHLTAAVAGRFGVSPVVPSAARHVPIVAFAVPFGAGSGRRVYSGGYDVSRTPLGAYLRDAIPIAGTELYLVDKGGRIVARNGATNSRSVTLRQIIGEKAAAVPGAAAGSYGSADRPRRFVTRKVAGTPWRIVVTASEARLQPSVHGVGWWLPWLAVLGFAIVGLVVGFLLLRLLAGREGLIASRTELAATVATLRERKQMLKGIIDNGSALISVKGLNGRYLLYNQAFADAFDLDERGSAEGKTGLEILLGRDDTWLAPELASAWRANDLEATRGARQFEEWSDHPVRGRISYDSIRFPLHDHEDRLYATCAISLDVSERLQVTERLREAEEHFRGAFDEAPIGMGLVRLDGRWTRVNQALCDFTGYTQDEFLTMTVEDITHPEDLPESRRSLQAVVSGEHSGFQIEKRYRHADGHPIWALQSVSLVRDGAGEPLHVISQIQDINERKHAQSELAVARDHAVEASRVKSEFLATMSHEIRTPLNGVIGMTELLRSTDLTPDQLEFAQAAATSGEALLRIVNDILDFSKLEADRLELDIEPFDLRATVQDTCRTFAAQVDPTQLELKVRVDDDVPALVAGDSVRIRQVLTSLVSNAVKFTAEGEVAVRVRVEHRDEESAEIRFEVSDTGIGIAEEEVGRLFEPFSQADSSTTRLYGGTGLGLAISRRLVDRMGSTIGVVSRPGFGSTFDFTLDLRTPSAPAGRPAALAACLPLLVVEDNPVNQFLLKTMLVRRGYRVAIADDGLQALERFVAGRFAAVFMDCQMPHLDGYGATRQIRAREQIGDRVPIIAITANAMTGDRERCLEAGMDDYLSKPLRPVQLEAVLERWIGSEDGPSAGEEAPTPAVAELVDDDRLRIFREDYGDIAEQLVVLFEQGTPPLIAELGAAHAQADDDAVRRAAHQIKGSCQSIGATFMATLAEGVEHGDDPVTGATRLDAAFGPTNDALRLALFGAPD